jgi:hypothetical protein
MANLIRLKQIESGSALSTAASVGQDFSSSVNEIVSQSLETTFSSSIINIITNNVGAVLPDGVISSSIQVILSDTTGSLTGSRVVGGTQASSVDYENVLNRPALVSGSLQIISILEPLNQFTASLDNTFATDAELAVTTSNLSIDMGEF